MEMTSSIDRVPVVYYKLYGENSYGDWVLGLDIHGDLADCQAVDTIHLRHEKTGVEVDVIQELAKEGETVGFKVRKSLPIREMLGLLEETYHVSVVIE